MKVAQLRADEKARHKGEGLKEGLHITYHENCQVQSKVNYSKGRKHGLCTEFFDNGVIQSQKIYVEGKQHEEAKTYYENGKLRLHQDKWVVVFKKGDEVETRLHGEERFYNEDGTLSWIEAYEKGRNVKGTYFNKDGSIKYQH